ncbi:putative RNA-directed DNA polymerase from transposon X-element, partial [Trichonephila clavipes]
WDTSQNLENSTSVIPIPKPGKKDPTLPDSFRPISLLPVLSKITEKIIQKRLCQHLNDNDILIPQQHGFRAGLSTSHQLLRVVEYIKDRISRPEINRSCFPRYSESV